MLYDWYLREYIRGIPLPALRKVDGTVNDDWVRTKAFAEDRHVGQEEVDKEVAHEERIIDEMLGLARTPQYPFPEDKERVFHEP